MIDVQENHPCQGEISESSHAQNAILLLTYLMAERLHAQDVPHLFSVAWQNVPSASMNSHCQSNKGMLIPIFHEKYKRATSLLQQD